jgi:hypothetical protein
MTSEDIMAASLSIIRGQGILKKQKIAQKLRETAENRPRFCSSLNEFLYILKTSMMTRPLRMFTEASPGRSLTPQRTPRRTPRAFVPAPLMVFASATYFTTTRKI